MAALSTSAAQAAAVAAEYALLREATLPLLEHLVRYHEQHDERYSSWLAHFDAMLWLKLAIVHGKQHLRLTKEYDLRQYLKLRVSVGLEYFKQHITPTAS